MQVSLSSLGLTQGFPVVALPYDMSPHSASEDARGAMHREQQWCPRGSPGLWDNSSQEDDYGLVANKRRSYSFTSGTALVSLSLPGGGTTCPCPHRH